MSRILRISSVFSTSARWSSRCWPWSCSPLSSRIENSTATRSCPKLSGRTGGKMGRAPRPDRLRAGQSAHCSCRTGFTARHRNRFGPGDESWQRKAVDALNAVCTRLDPAYEDMSRKKVSFRRWAQDFSWLRNRTRGHWTPLAATLSAICPELAESLNQVRFSQ